MNWVDRSPVFVVALFSVLSILIIDLTDEIDAAQNDLRSFLLDFGLSNDFIDLNRFEWGDWKNDNYTHQMHHQYLLLINFFERRFFVFVAVSFAFCSTRIGSRWELSRFFLDSTVDSELRGFERLARLWLCSIWDSMMNEWPKSERDNSDDPSRPCYFRLFNQVEEVLSIIPSNWDRLNAPKIHLAQFKRFPPIAVHCFPKTNFTFPFRIKRNDFLCHY